MIHDEGRFRTRHTNVLWIATDYIDAYSRALPGGTRYLASRSFLVIMRCCRPKTVDNGKGGALRHVRAHCSLFARVVASGG